MPAHLSDPERLLDACAQGSERTHALLEELLASLDAPRTRQPAAALLHALTRRLSARKAAGHEGFLTTTEITLQDHTLHLLQLPSVFAPEQWSLTFYEGLSRMASAEFEGRTIAELGSGNGWISLALARSRRPHKIYGLDINPRAVLCARLNAYLNATASDGTLLPDPSGRSLLDRVEFHVSDVLTWCRTRNLQLDRVIGCIPQVLDPTLEVTEDATLRSRSDEFLYALSNYCGRQGFVEDNFGLGLMARGLEEAIGVLNPGGKVVFNLGGRPGQARLRRLFERRGYVVQEIWRTRAEQAKDTEIGALLEIEARSAHRFEFFLDPLSDEPVSARTAAAFASAGGTIYHSINVFQAELPNAPQIRRIFSVLADPTFEEAHEAIDLAFDAPAVAEEKIGFLAELSERLARPVSFPYGDTAGLSAFRERIAEYLSAYFGTAIGPDSVLITPTRAAALIALLLCHRPERALIERDLARLLFAGGPRPRWGATEILEAPSSLELCRQLLEKLRPGVLVVGLTAPESHSLDALEHLIATAAETDTALVLDLSAGFELSSAPSPQPALRLLGERPLPDHVTLLCGLVKDDVYRDLELGLVISENAAVLSTLSHVAELTYSRPPLLVQEYYSTILADLLSFRIRKATRPVRLPRPPRRPPAGALQARHPSLSGGAHALLDSAESLLAARDSSEAPAPKAAASSPATFSSFASQGALPGLLRLDYGENTLLAPTSLRAHLLEAFVRRELTASEGDLRPELAELVRRRFGCEDVAAERIAVASGVAPLFSSAMAACADSGGGLLLPTGAYGYFAGGAALWGVRVRSVETSREHAFKVTPEALERALRDAPPRPWLYLNAPVVNPTGAVYTPEELRELFDVARANQVTLLIDTVFAGLEHDPQPPPSTPSSEILGLLLDGMPALLLGGISKELAAGGLRFGYGYATTDALAGALRGSAAYGVPHATLRYAVKRTVADLLAPEARLASELMAQQRLLGERAGRLSDVLRSCGWDPLEPRGGLFLLARPSAYLGRTLQLPLAGRTASLRLEGEGLVTALRATTGLLVNGPGFTGIPEHYRFVLSVEEEVFERALRALPTFRELLSRADGAPTSGASTNDSPADDSG